MRSIPQKGRFLLPVKTASLSNLGKQVRDNIHSDDLVGMFHHFHQAPRPGEVYNAGGGRHSNVSMMEARALCEEITGNRMDMKYSDQARIGAHSIIEGEAAVLDRSKVNRATITGNAPVPR